jgi:hypothetical protein
MKRKPTLKVVLISVAVAALILGGAAYWFAATEDEPSSTTQTSTAATVSTLDLDDGDEDIDWDSLPTTTTVLGESTLEITTAGTYILSGTTTASIHINSDGNVRLALNGVSITSTTGPAIYTENAETTVIQLVEGTENTLQDATTRSDETIDAVVYSSDDLVINGTGSLTVTARFADAIASTDDLKITSGTYAITSADDGVRGRDSVRIEGGTITIKAEGDAIKATNDTDAAKGYIYITNGAISITAGDDGIHAEEKVVIEGGEIDIVTSTEGIEGSAVTIEGGEITLYASDDGINAPGSTFTAAVITINSGTLTIEVGQGDTDAIDANGNIYVNGGTITITAQVSSFDYDGTAEFNGGTITINGQQVDSIPVSHMGGGGR